MIVAPRAGAWLETALYPLESAFRPESRPVRARGLKRLYREDYNPERLSRPVRARGLKP